MTIQVNSLREQILFITLRQVFSYSDARALEPFVESKSQVGPRELSASKFPLFFKRSDGCMTKPARISLDVYLDEIVKYIKRSFYMNVI